MATIKAIEARTVHQIQSGQVIVDLCSVVKELVENSVDAGATNIEVRFKNQGLDSIEVQDNGDGIGHENYETLALKHFTSKLSTYEDLTSLQTFGFRGEALSSLCALSKFSVVTCMASDAPKGTKLEFETSGKLRGTSVIAAQRGTTVTVEGLFNNLPVRRRELERNVKREWNKVIGLLNQYACILTGVKFSVSQQPTKGKKIVLFSTKGNATTRENIVNVFGAKTLTVLIPLELEHELEPTITLAQRESIQGDGNNTTTKVKIRGHVSRPTHGEGRQTPDRQMFFVNGRPCGLPQFAKVFNEVYKSYNASQSPFIFADIQLDTHMYDVNVSPDKRTILLHDQSRLLDNVRESLVALFEAQEYSVPQSQLGGLRQTPFKKLSMSRQSTLDSDIRSTRSPSVGGQSSVANNADPEADHNSSAEQDQKDTDEVAELPSQSRASFQNSSAQAAKSSDLISQWAGKKTNEPRRDSPQPGKGQNPDNTHSNKGTDTGEPEDEEAAHESSQRGVPRIQNKMTDLKTYLDVASRGKTTTETVEIENEVSEPPIPSISTPSRGSEIKNVRYSPPRTKRRGPELVTVTIDDETTTSLIGSPAKKARTEKARIPNMHKHRATAKPPAQMPSFQGRLTQMFSASSVANTVSQNSPITTGLVDGTSRSRSLSAASASSEGLFVESEKDFEDGASSPAPLDETENVQDVENNSTPALAASQPDSPVEEHNTASESENSNSGEPSDTDGDYIDEDEKKAQEESRIRDMIETVEHAAKTSSDETQKRQQTFIKGTTKRKEVTCQLQQKIQLDTAMIRSAFNVLEATTTQPTTSTGTALVEDGIDGANAEERLSLTISKPDFGKMKIVGQFNLGFILAIRPSEKKPDNVEEWHATDDELFIIDQHATDEKYNFERLQASTVVQSQRLVQPKPLELTAIEEEVIKENIDALENNGFLVSIDESGYQPVGSRCQLLSLPLSRETTFTLADLEELISLLTDHQSTSANTIPRPSKVRKMFAMRACRSSVMIGKSLSNKQMEKLVRHMGELDKPWNCPHGRPTMRHLCGLGAWDESVWQEGDGPDGEQGTSTNWAAYVKGKREP